MRGPSRNQVSTRKDDPGLDPGERGDDLGVELPPALSPRALMHLVLVIQMVKYFIEANGSFKLWMG